MIDIACTLDATVFGARVAEWREVARHATERSVQPGRVSATYPGELRDRLAVLIEAESRCCPFLAFEMKEDGASIRLDLTFPAGAEAMVAPVIGFTR